MSEYLVKAIKSLKPGAEFSIIDNDYSTITWDVLEGNAPTKTELNSEWKNMLGHQLRNLLPFKQLWEELPDLFNWLNN